MTECLLALNMEPCGHDKLIEEMNFVVVLFFSRKAAVPKVRYIVQWHHEMLHWCLEQEVDLAKKDTEKWELSQHIHRQQVLLHGLT